MISFIYDLFSLTKIAIFVLILNCIKSKQLNMNKDGNIFLSILLIYYSNGWN